MHGLGNCYVYINAFQHPIPEEKLPALAKELSNVSTGIGSDGLILICPSKKAHVRMRIFNKDGSEAKNCGNGLRCVAKYAFDHKLVSTREIKIETEGGIVTAFLLDENQREAIISVNMGKPLLLRQEIPMIGRGSQNVINEPFQIKDKVLKLTAVSMGNPHAVFFVKNLNDSSYMTLGPEIEKDPRFPERINVEFIFVESSTSLHCRVWERGSGITTACGTGACASAVAAILNGISHKDESIAVHLEGGDLTVQWKSEGDVIMTGPAAYIASGTYVNSN